MYEMIIVANTGGVCAIMNPFGVLMMSNFDKEE
jgi:hypothetical protein